MSYKPRSLLCLVLVLLMAVAAVPAMAVVPSFDVEVYDNSGQEGAFDQDGVYAWEVVKHKMYAKVVELEPAGLNASVKWASTKPKVASVNQKGVISCKKSGDAIISVTVTDKATREWKRLEFPVKVYDNGIGFSGIPQDFVDDANETGRLAGAPKQIYEKGGNVYAQLYVYNGARTTAKKAESFRVYFWYDGDDFPNLDKAFDMGMRKAPLSKAIAPGAVGTTKPFKVGKPGGFKANRDYLCWAYLAISGSGGKSADGFGPMPVMPKGAVGAVVAKRLGTLTREGNTARRSS